MNPISIWSADSNPWNPWTPDVDLNQIRMLLFLVAICLFFHFLVGVFRFLAWRYKFNKPLLEVFNQTPQSFQDRLDSSIKLYSFWALVVFFAGVFFSALLLKKAMSDFYTKGIYDNAQDNIYLIARTFERISIPIIIATSISLFSSALSFFTMILKRSYLQIISSKPPCPPA